MLLSQTIKCKNRILEALYRQAPEQQRFVFVEAQPLVQSDRNLECQPCGNFTRHRSFSKDEILKSLAEQNCACVVRSEILNEKFIFDFCKTGARVLHFGSTQIRDDIIQVEAREEIGLMGKWSFGFLFDWLFYSLKEAGRKALPVECVVLTTPNIKTVQGIFNRLGAPYVVSFVTANEVSCEYDFFEYEKKVVKFTKQFYA